MRRRPPHHGTRRRRGCAGDTGAATGTLQPLPFEYKFKGDYYSLEKLIHNVRAWSKKRNRQLAVSGRLIVIEGFSLNRSKVTIVATSYMLPADQSLFGGATPAGPAGERPPLRRPPRRRAASGAHASLRGGDTP